MEEVVLELEPALLEELSAEADDHGFMSTETYLKWILKHREETAGDPPGGFEFPGEKGATDPDADLSQSTSTGSLGSESGSTDPSLDPDADSADTSIDPASEAVGDAADDVDLPPETEGADDDDIAKALEEIEDDIDDEES